MKKILCLSLVLFSAVFSEEVPQGRLRNESSPRFQEPILPYPYKSEEVVFQNASAGVQLSGTFTLPNDAGPFPVVILLHGSSPLDRDSSFFGHKPFLVWADHLTKQGIAVLRFDKRGAGSSAGIYNDSTIEDFAEDALAAVAYLKTRREINPLQIGLIGHSEGGMTAALAGSKSEDVAFIVFMAAPCVPWAELIPAQEKALQRIAGKSEEVIAQNLRHLQEIFAVLQEEPDRAIAVPKLRELLLRQETETGVDDCDLEDTIQFYNSAWYRYNLSYEPSYALKQIQIPVLAISGELDFVVSPDQNLSRIAQLLEEVGHIDHTIVRLPKINHAFQTCEIGSAKECEELEETAAPVVLDILSQWILEKTAYDARLLRDSL